MKCRFVLLQGGQIRFPTYMHGADAKTLLYIQPEGDLSGYQFSWEAFLGWFFTKLEL